MTDNEPRLYITHPARCNRRACQARRNLSKHPALYVHWPKCRVCKKGRMAVDWGRMLGKEKQAPVCSDPNCPWTVEHLRKSGKLVPMHRVSTRGCSGFQDYVIERSLVNSKQSPNKPDGGNDAPF